MIELLQAIWQVIVILSELLVRFALQWSLLIAWVAWWLLGVNWRRGWQVLAEGAWVPAALLVLLSALVWSQMAPATCDCLGFVTVPNFWWQLGEVGLIAGLALFCGWLQTYFGWYPVEVNLEPPAHGHGHDHGHTHGHAHGNGHSHEPVPAHSSHHGHH